MVTSKRRPSERSVGHPPRKAPMGAASSVADITTSFRSGRAPLLEPAQQRERDVAGEVALVELVEHHHAHVLAGWGPTAGAGRARPR